MKNKNIDLSPEEFDIEEFLQDKNPFKKFVRAYLYPILNFISTLWLSFRYSSEQFSPDFWLCNQRGNDYPRLRHRVNKFKKISDSEILIAGCGSGKDTPSWLIYKPKKIIGVDLFNYTKSWQKVKSFSRKINSHTSIEMYQGNLESLENIENESLDIVASDAVFEHIRNLNPVLSEFYRVLKPGGVLYATFGPMWFSWGGDHHSGNDDLDNGYNHLLLSKKFYRSYINVDKSLSHCENDGRTWIKENLFSYLRPSEYLDHLNKCGFRKLQLGVIFEPRALKYSKRNPENWKKLRDNNSAIDLLLTGMTIIYEKPKL